MLTAHSRKERVKEKKDEYACASSLFSNFANTTQNLFDRNAKLVWHKICLTYQNANIEQMNYEIPAGTARYIQKSCETALKFSLPQTDTLCMLYSVLEDDDLCKMMANCHVDCEEMKHQVETVLSGKATGNAASLSSDLGAIGQQELPPLDFSAHRIVKLLVLEGKLSGGKYEGALLLVLAILHDRDNEAKRMLVEKGVSYKSLLSARTSQRPTDDFRFPDEDDSVYPSDERPNANKVSNATKENKKAATDTPVIDKFGTDLTVIAAKGGLDPVVGRESEIERVVQILCRRKKNNPIIIGEPGVGKSAIVEGLADRIAHHRVPHLLQNKRIVALDMAAIVAGTQYRGQFEERIRRIIEELKAHKEIVLFIDEIHTIIGAGSAPGSLDAANILKPALARGEVQCIGATTTGEFKKSIEKDGALDRRFQKIMLEPTTREESLTILHNIKPRYESHHNVTYTDDALKACVELTARYVTDRALPDKAIDAMDEAGARMHLAGTGTPKEIEDKEKEIETLREEKLNAARRQDYELAANLRDRVQSLTDELEAMTRQWQEQQKEHPAEVDEETIAFVVSKMSGVPVTKVAMDETARLKGMRDALAARVIAQDKAIEKLSRAIARSRLGLKGADHPIGTFLFVGPTGVGKTHLVKCLAEWMFGTKDALIRIDMSEYGEKYSVSRLVGAPPGYVGYEEGGQLTERVRRHPYSVILLDEIEKAHPDVFNTLLQVMDEGRMTDGNGTTVDFRNTIIILTSNSGTRQLREFGSGLGFDRVQGALTGEAAESIIMKTLRKQFAPEFLNRLDDVIMFNPLDKASALKIAEIELSDLGQRMNEAGYALQLSDATKELVVEKGFDAQYGARSLKRAIQQYIEDKLCDHIMDHPQDKTLRVDVKDKQVEINS